MKLKRFLALAVSLAMVLSIVPAFSLTASAAETVLFDVDNITGSGEQEISVAGWTKTENGAAVRWNQNWGAEGTGVWGSTGTYALMFFFSNTRGSSNGNTSATINTAANTKGATKVSVNFNFACQTAADLYQRWWFRDADGNDFASFYFDKNVKAEVGMNTITQVAASGSDVLAMRGTNIDITAEKNEAGTYTVTYTIGGTVVATETVDSVNGFGSIYADVPSWNQQWAAAGLQDLVITYVLPETSKTVVATYTLNGETVGTVSKTYDTATATGVDFPQYIAPCTNGSNTLYAAEATTLSDDTTIELEAIANVGTHAVGDIVAVNGVQYEIKSANLIPNADFALGTVGWFGGDGNQLGASVSNGAVTLGNAGGGNNASLNQSWAIEAEKTYLYTYNTTSGGNTWHITSLQNAVKCDENTTGAPVLVGTTNGGTYVGTLAASDATGTNNFVFTNTDGYAYLQSAFRWTGATFSNFGLYEIAEAEVAVTEEVASMAAIAPVKVIGDTAVVLPSTVAVTGSLGSVVDAPITWDAPASYEVGETTVNGVATVQFGEQEATTAEVSTTVTVLAETFTIDSFTSVNGQDPAKANQKAFPVAISDAFSMEFNANYASFGDLFITIKTADAGFFGPEQIALGVNAEGGFRPVNGNGSGGRAQSDSTLATLTAGTNYRFFLEADASTDKYTVTVFDAATGVAVAEASNFGFRTSSDAIAVITALTNNGAGEVTLSNIKVNANVSKTEYTINITMDGETNTTTASFWSEAEAVASIADVAGYEKTVTVEGTTINVVYSATQTLAATFIDANENVIKAVSEVVAIGETYTVAAEEIFFLDGDYNGYFYQIPETVLSADNNNLVVTVTETPNKYAVKEDALITGGTEIWGVKAENNNSVFVASAGSASAPTQDANGENNFGGGNTPSTLGTSRLGFFLFPVVDVQEGQKVTANFYVREWHSNGFSNGNTMLRLAAHAVTDNSWATLSDGDTSYSAPDATLLESWNTPVFSDDCYNNLGYITFDVTEVMVAAKAAGLTEITLRLNAPYGAAYIAEREKATAGKAYAGNAAYLAVEDAGLVKVTETGNATLTKNGSAMNGFAYVAATDDVRLVGDGAVVVATDAGYYYANQNLNLTEATAFENTVPTGLGLAMVSGAQVRIGTTELADGAKLDALADSGIRFLATANYTDTVLADDTVEFGIKVTAEGSDQVTFVPAVKFQDADETVFTAAITGLAESNYNRKYTAVAYAKVTMADGSVAEFTTDSVTRSVYQVSAGIMKNGSADAEGAAYTVDGVVKNILNAYVNQTGIRLTYTADGITVEEGKYTGDVFFTVESTVNEDGSVAVTITPDTTWGTPAEIAEWWTDYVRVNNNNSVAKTYISDAAVDENGVLTFTFTVPAAE